MCRFKLEETKMAARKKQIIGIMGGFLSESRRSEWLKLIFMGHYLWKKMLLIVKSSMRI